MPVYEYEHADKPCALGKTFEFTQSLADRPLKRCPQCRGNVHRILSLTNISTPKGNSALRDMGFTKLVKRDDGVYENVTRRDGDSRYMVRGKPETIPDISKTIGD
jgi:putative FmdB family regulatory protein